jgi:biopolymer transport protein ExbB/TolQ
MAQGLTVIAAGLVVVLCIMASMFVFIEVILKLDQVQKRRAERASASPAAKTAEATPAADADASGKKEELIAAVGLALQKHSAAGALRKAAAGTASGPTPWASSGRLGIMAERQRVTGRRS